MSAVPTPRSGRFAALAGGVGISVLAAYITLQERHDVNARRVESYSTLPVLLLFVGLGVLLAALATTSPRRTRIGLAALLIWSSCAATTRALWDTSLPHSTPPIQSSPTASPPTIPAIRLAAAPTSSKTEACVSSQLAAIAYTGGLATGTEYFFVAITNHSSRPCSTGERFDLMTGTTNETTTLASIKSSQTFGKPINVLAPNTRGIAAVTTTWAAELPGDADCPDNNPHPTDHVTSIQLTNRTVIELAHPFDLERCIRSIGPITDDASLARCEHMTRPVCQPITATKPRIG